MSTSDKAAEAAINAASNLAANVYADVAGPSARRIGVALESVFKIGLSPVSLLDWGFEKSKDWLLKRIEKRLASTPEEFHQTPPSQIAVPLLLAISSLPDSEELRELYAELLMKAMDSRTTSSVHPSYASVLGQLTPQEALLLNSLRSLNRGSLFIDRPRRRSDKGNRSIEVQFQDHCYDLGFESPDPELWLENLLRLRLLEFNTYTDAVYVAADYDRPEPSVETSEERHLTITDYGANFIDACAPPASGDA